MKLAFVAHSHGNLALLEKALITLVERYKVERVIALETAADDAEAVLRARDGRFPTKVEWQAPGYSDYVLASVLNGVVEVSPDEVARTRRIEQAVTPSRGGGEVLVLGGRRIGVGVTNTDPASLSAVVLTAVGRRVVARDEPPVRVAPGHVRAPAHDGEPAACLVIGVVEGKLQGQFITPDGARIGNPEILEVRAEPA